MILPLLLAQAMPAPSPAPAGDVVVTAERLRRLRLATTISDGHLADCSVRVSSGDPSIDLAACRAMRACVDQGVTTSEPLANCIDTRVAAFVRAGATPPSDNK